MLGWVPDPIRSWQNVGETQELWPEQFGWHRWYIFGGKIMHWSGSVDSSRNAFLVAHEIHAEEYIKSSNTDHSPKDWSAKPGARGRWRSWAGWDLPKSIRILVTCYMFTSYTKPWCNPLWFWLPPTSCMKHDNSIYLCWFGQNNLSCRHPGDAVVHLHAWQHHLYSQAFVNICIYIYMYESIFKYVYVYVHIYIYM